MFFCFCFFIYNWDCACAILCVCARTILYACVFARFCIKMFLVYVCIVLIGIIMGVCTLYVFFFKL